GVVGVEALHARGRTAYAAARARAAPPWRHGGVALGGVAVVGGGYGVGIDLGFGPAHAAGRLQPADGQHFGPADQPEAGRAPAAFASIASAVADGAGAGTAAPGPSTVVSRQSTN